MNRRFMRMEGLQARLLLAFGAASALVMVLALMTWLVGGSATEAARRVAHTHEVLNSLAQTHAQTLLIELSTQGYRLTGDPGRLAERDAAIQSREVLLQRIRELTQDHAEQQQRWSQLRLVVNQRLAISREVEQVRNVQGPDAANALVARLPLAQTRQQVHDLLAAMVQTERQLLLAREDEQRRIRGRLLAWASIAAASLLLLLGFTALALRRQLQSIQRARRQLADSEDSLATTLQSIGDAVLATDTAGRITRMNPVAERLTGWTLEQAQGQPIEMVFCLVDEHSGEPIRLPLEQVLGSGEVAMLDPQALLIARDGRRWPIADSAAPIRNEAGQVQGVVLVFRDETAARQAQRAIGEQYALLEQRVQERTRQLRESEQHLRSVINNVPALITYVDADQRYVYANEQYCERFAPGLSQITGCTVREVLGEARYAIAAPMIAKVLAGEPQSYDWQPFPEVWQVISYVANRDEQGRVVGYYVLGTDITARRQAEQALRASEQQLERVLEGSDQGYWEWNLKTQLFQVSARWEAMLGYRPGEMAVSPNHWPELVHPEDLALAMQSIERHLAGLSPAHEVELRARTKDGRWRWLLTRGRIVMRDADGSPLLMSGTHTDIDERKQLELEQREAGVVFENCYEGIMVANAEGLITKVNPAFTRITGYEEAEVQGRSPRLLSSGRHDASFYRDFWQSLNEQDVWRGEIWNRRKDGEPYPALQSVSAVRDPKGKVSHYVSVFTDISERKAHEAELNRVANFDSLTDLPNRRLLSDRLDQAISRSARSGRSTAVCFLDLDGFKDINDQLGHATGDALLIGVAGHLKAALRADDTLARIGGDEFVILLSEVHTPEECALILDRMLQTVRQPVQVAGQLLRISASIGVSLYPADNADPDTLMRHADQAMYLAKQAGKDRYQLFDPEIDRFAQQHREQLARTRQALAREEFLLYYQPKVDLGSGALIGVEALIRWQHPERGLLPPGEFLPQLHGSDLERPFGEWVIATALRQIEAWAAQGLALPVSVNISASHLLQADFAERLAQALAARPSVNPRDLDLEVLETAAIGDMRQAALILQRCRTLGVSFSLDDFGTGYSSLTYLRKLPVETLKIDQSFVRDMLVDADDLSIVKGVIELAGAFQRRVIAEGVETLEHGALLRRMGCRFVQGYGIARPMPAEQLPAWRERWLQARAWEAL